MGNKLQLYVDTKYRKLHIRSGSYLIRIGGNKIKIDDVGALDREMLELDEDPVDVWEVLGEELRKTGISLDRAILN